MLRCLIFDCYFQQLSQKPVLGVQLKKWLFSEMETNSNNDIVLGFFWQMSSLNYYCYCYYHPRNDLDTRDLALHSWEPGKI